MVKYSTLACRMLSLPKPSQIKYICPFSHHVIKHTLKSPHRSSECSLYCLLYPHMGVYLGLDRFKSQLSGQQRIQFTLKQRRFKLCISTYI